MNLLAKFYTKGIMPLKLYDSLVCVNLTYLTTTIKIITDYTLLF